MLVERCKRLKAPTLKINSFKIFAFYWPRIPATIVALKTKKIKRRTQSIM